MSKRRSYTFNLSGLVKSAFRLQLFLVLFALSSASKPVTGQIGIVESLAAEDGLWEFVETAPVSSDATVERIPSRFLTARLNLSAFGALMARVPRESSAAAASRPTLTLPMPDGRMARFRVVESPVMEPELAAQFPGIRTYSAQGVDDPDATARLDWTPEGVHGLVLSTAGTVYVDPYAMQSGLYRTYYKADGARDLAQTGPLFTCYYQPGAARSIASRLSLDTKGVSSGPVLRTYRLAVAATGEYTRFHGGTVERALAAIVTTINRVTVLYERDFAIRFTLVADQSKIIYTDPATDPYTAADASGLADQNQPNLDAVIGNANYDLGHVFTVGSGGVGAPGLCVSGVKAQGATGTDQPIADPYDVDYVAHEVIHQLGGDHTFNSSAEGCDTNRSATSAFEPGSGSTAASYSGLCTGANLQNSSDDYFHSSSYLQVVDFVTNGDGKACGVQTPTGNNPPAVSAGSDFTIPRSTPFTLTATGSDPDGDRVTYTWEEYDLGPASPPETDDGMRPIFRSFRPTIDPSRTFPRLRHILDSAGEPPATFTVGQSTFLTGEVLPSTTRVMKFRVLARDNRAGGGGVSEALTTVNVTANAGPFSVLQPNTDIVWAAGSSQAITWNVANTASVPVNTANVKISLSTDGGLTFPTVLASSVPNNGTASITAPNVSTAAARVRVEAVGNIFFDISDRNFTIAGGVPAPAAASTRSYAIPLGGGTSLVTEGTGALTIGYVRIQPSGGSGSPAGLAIFGFRQGGVLVTEAGVTASPLIRNARFYASVNGPVNTGVAIANPNPQPVTISFSLTDTAGTTTPVSTFPIPANGQTAAFLNQSPFNAGASFEGTLSLTSSLPVSAIALRGFTNERAEFLFTTLPVVDLDRAPVSERLTFSHYAEGGGWTTQLALVNPTNSAISGTVEFYNQGSATAAGAPASINVDGQTASQFSYSIPPRSVRRLSTSGAPASVVSGSIRVVPSGTQPAPSGLAIFSYRTGGVTVSEAGVPALRAARSQRMYAELSGPIVTGVAVANPGLLPTTATFTLTNLAGATLGTSNLTIPANGQTALFLNQLPGFQALASIQGVLKVSTESTAGLSVVALRARTNERGDFLITTTPPVDEGVNAAMPELLFPHIADGGGFTTQFVLFGNTTVEAPSGTLKMFTQAGSSLSTTLR